MKTSGTDYPEPIFAGENKMRTRLAGFVFVLVFIMAMTYSGFMVWAQETTGQTAEQSVRCDPNPPTPTTRPPHTGGGGGLPVPTHTPTATPYLHAYSYGDSDSYPDADTRYKAKSVCQLDSSSVS